MKHNKAFVHLSNIPKRVMNLSDLSDESKRKIIDTVNYAMDANGETDRTVVLLRCTLAQMAEQYVAEWMEGHVMHGEEDTSDPWTYAFDVLAGPKYYGMRIEVKTHQSDSQYISVHTGHTGPFKGTTGLNIRPFLEQPQADLIIVFNVKRVDGGWELKPFVLTDRDSLLYESVVVPSKFDGWYLNRYVSTATQNNLNICYF